MGLCGGEMHAVRRVAYNCLPSSPLPICSWGRIAGAAYCGAGYMPSPAAIELMWDRTKRLSLAFDPQGASNMLVGGRGEGQQSTCMSLALAA